MRPVIKYRGGKQRELPFLRKWIPDSFNRYVEPFFGGGALFFDIEPDNSLINDLNRPLMRFYDDLAEEFNRLVEEITEISMLYEANWDDYLKRKAESPNERIFNANESLYYALRSQYNGLSSSEYLFGTLYYFINKTAYSGMLRFNSKGEYNVPFGRYRHFGLNDLSKDHSVLLQRAKRMCTDFEEVLSQCEHDDFVFLDPPYDTTFSDYGNIPLAGDFDEGDHRRLADVFYSLPCKALIVIGSTPLTEELYGDTVVERYEKTYSVNIRNRFKAGSEHILAINR